MTCSGSARPGRCTTSVAGRWFTAPDFTGPWTFASLTTAGRLQEDSARARALARARVGARHRSGGRGGAARAACPQTARVDKKTVKAPEVKYRRRPAVRADREDDGLARCQHRQGHHQGRRSLLHVLPGRLVHVESPTGPWEVTGAVPKQIYEIPVSSPSHTVTYVTVEERQQRCGGVRVRPRCYTGLMVAWGCAVWGTGYYYPPYVWYGGGYPIYRPFYPDLRLQRLVQPVDRHVRPRRRRVWSVRRRRSWRAIQPVHRDLRAGCRSLRAVWGSRGRTGLQRANRNLRARRCGGGSVRRPRRGRGLQPAHRDVRRHPSGRRRLRQLGPDRRAARRRLGDDLAGHQPRHRHDDASDARGAAAARSSVGTQPDKAEARLPVRAAAATSTPATTATSTRRTATAGRSTTAAGGTTSNSQRRNSVRRRRTGHRRVARRRATGRARRGGIRRLPGSSVVIRPRAATARSARRTTAACAAAPGPRARAATGRAAVRRAAAEAGVAEAARGSGRKCKRRGGRRSAAPPHLRQAFALAPRAGTKSRAGPACPLRVF